MGWGILIYKWAGDLNDSAMRQAVEAGGCN
jgi:hypothetical protein